jgi:hypothetical protein
VDRVDAALTALVKTAEVMSARDIRNESKAIKSNAQAFADLERKITATPWFDQDLTAQINAHDEYAGTAEKLMNARLLDTDARAGDLGAALPFSELRTQPGNVFRRLVGMDYKRDPELEYMTGHYGNFQDPSVGALGGRRTLAYETMTGRSKWNGTDPIKLTPEMAKLMTAEQANEIAKLPPDTPLPVVFGDVLRRWEHGERTGEYIGAGGQAVTRDDFLNAFAKKLKVLYRPNERAPLAMYRELAGDVAGGMDGVRDSRIKGLIAPLLRAVTARGRSLRS